MRRYVKHNEKYHSIRIALSTIPKNLSTSASHGRGIPLQSKEKITIFAKKIKLHNNMLIEFPFRGC